jgi:pimeloyl-ACP methyl ester carboxylesterase
MDLDVKTKHNKPIHHRVMGSGKPVVCLHGLGASHHDWDLLIPPMISAGYQCYTLDLPGHGKSIKPEQINQYHIDQIYTYFENWLNQQQIDEPIVLIGHSMGGFLSILYAAQHPEKISALILVDPLFAQEQMAPITWLLKRYPNRAAQAIKYAPRWLIYTLTGFDPSTSKYFSDQHRVQVAEDYKRASPNIMYITRSFYDLYHKLETILKPTLVIWGEQDRTLIPKSFPKLVRVLNNASGYPVHGGGHQPHLSHATQVNDQILKFLDTVDQNQFVKPTRSDHSRELTTRVEVFSGTD